MKRILAVLLSSALLFASCGKPAGNADNKDKNKDAKPKVTVTTSFLGDMVKNLAGDHVNIDVIIPAGDDPHLYTLKPQDSARLKNADLVLYHGLHFEGKMVDILEKLGKAVTKDFDKKDLLTMDEDGKEITDPHFWFDLTLYGKAVQEASNQLVALLPANADEIKKNTTKYLEELKQLDKESREAIASIPKGNRYLITPHDAFQYFSRNYDIPVFSPQGVSTDSEVAIKDIQNTVDFVLEHKVKAIFAESTTDPQRMEKIREACKARGFDVKVVSGDDAELFSDSLAKPGHKGDTFIDMVKHNVKLIVENLK